MPVRLLRVRGRVQGVGFRDACVEAARARGLAGWVRNRRDGSVEILVAGDVVRLDAFAGWLRHGVSLARVDGVESVESEADGLSGFERRPTA